MGLFSFFKKKSLPDPFFGNLEYHVAKGRTWFEGQKWFAPVSKEASFLVDADAEGPTEAQRNFYSTVERDYSTLVAKIRPILEEEFQNWKEDFMIQDFAEEFTLDHLQIPRPDVTPIKWVIVFTSIHDLNHYFTIELEGMEPKSVLIDG